MNDFSCEPDLHLRDLKWKLGKEGMGARFGGNEGRRTLIISRVYGTL
jgi:hypothetical protein